MVNRAFGCERDVFAENAQSQQKKEKRGGLLTENETAGKRAEENPPSPQTSAKRVQNGGINTGIDVATERGNRKGRRDEQQENSAKQAAGENVHDEETAIKNRKTFLSVAYFLEKR